MTASGSIATAASIQVVAGSTIVTPASMCAAVRAVAQERRSLRHVGAGVDAERGGRIGVPVADHRPAGRDERADCVGQVELALVVLGVEPRERGPQVLGAKDVDARVDLGQGPLVSRRVAHLDDALHAAAGPADDAAEVDADRIRSLERQHGGGRPGVGVRRAQRLEARRVGQRMVGIEHEHVAAEALERGPGGTDRITGPERPLLGDRLDPARQARADGVGAGRHDHEHPVGPGLEAGRDRPVDQRAPEDLVQHLRRRRAHARALTGGEENTGEWRAVSHAGSGRSVLGSWGAWIRTRDHGTKTRCLTTWPRPIERGREGLGEYTSGGPPLDPVPQVVPSAAARAGDDALAIGRERPLRPARELEVRERGAARRAWHVDM